MKTGAVFFSFSLLALAAGVVSATDFNGDGTNDIAVFRSTSGLWAIRGVTRIYFGGSFNDRPLVGDYKYDSVIDLGVFRPSSGVWAVRGITRIYYGGSGDEPLFGDDASLWYNNGSYGSLEAQAYSVLVNDLDPFESDLDLTLAGYDDMSSVLKVEMGIYGGLGQGYGHVGTSTSHPLYIKAGGGTRITVDQTGNVGIGTTSPGQLLEVEGSNPRILVSAQDSSNPELNFETGGTYSTDWAIYKHYWEGDLRFYNGFDALTLEYATGNVGIGTTSPAGRLDVSGAIYQRGGVIHADYVFSSDYPLETIEEHARQMWKEKHLKAIPRLRRDEAGREVVEFGSHQRGIVEELEKAHIYIEQLHGRLKKMEKKLARLEGDGGN
jgi:hypothetical protein